MAERRDRSREFEGENESRSSQEVILDGVKVK